jgi:membrane protease YdiL (CAAX protease family)
MNHDSPTLLEVVLITAIVASSAVAWYYIVSRVASGLPVLAYRRRRPVPWNLLDVMLFLGSVAIATQLAMTIVKQRVEIVDRFDALTLFAFAIGELYGSGIGLFLVFSRHHIDFRRLRWRRWRIRWDLVIGLGGFAAMAVPTYMLQMWLSTLLEPTSHPLVEMLTENGDSRGFWAAAFAAIIAAPITEEVLFRMLLQGWLESAAARIRLARPPLEPADCASELTTPFFRPMPEPARWPILVSAGLFAAAHYGNGPDPIPLFLLGLALGYLYRQTHRLAPCVIMHAGVNACSMLILWLHLWGG